MKVCIEADGGSRGNPGIAGSGTVLLDAARDNVLRRIAEFVGTSTNNVAEYHSLINGLQAAQELGATDVDVFMDSKLVVEQMSGRWKVKHPDMKTLALRAQRIAAGFRSVTYTWVPRAENSRADELANAAMDAGAKGADPGLIVNETTSWNGAVTRPSRLILLRHGQTELSAARRYSGVGDPELTELGERQAAAAAERLGTRGGIDYIVSSPLARARRTAEHCAEALGVDVAEHPGLIEMDFGQWEGKTFQEACDADPALHAAWMRDATVAPPGGESLQAADQRAVRTLAELQDTYGAANILVVSHVTPIKAMLRKAFDAGPQFFHRLHLDLASLSVAEFYADGPTCVRLVNDTSHLNGV
ncbi:bifunctional RNase H/acid phosphatase [Corynebacterium sp.]|uniref:bifunctional RNase H/acid phosphatase n=1 Tax=Corynebacterium sp. TaxID=1720 RepID=UPI0026DBC3FE|nr:bifunctional RNase H/acid phosphatase [Corynebacterium sp.]MDO5076003.1 bifunctional RNase H/acid phosphatase [Corynebacterium sp.]